MFRKTQPPRQRESFNREIEIDTQPFKELWIIDDGIAKLTVNCKGVAHQLAAANCDSQMSVLSACVQGSASTDETRFAFKGDVLTLQPTRDLVWSGWIMEEEDLPDPFVCHLSLERNESNLLDDMRSRYGDHQCRKEHISQGKSRRPPIELVFHGAMHGGNGRGEHSTVALLVVNPELTG
ncbi:MAG TPA: hypothetical protein VFV87_07610 [Pirellulaceae bacterium]|nr:hypothetical protein [Pirellulaceae bacterium]